MKVGICKECFGEVELVPENDVSGETMPDFKIYECPICDYPNGIRCGDFWEIYEKDKTVKTS
jgi:uncharacterized protein (DUF736 family)